MMVALIEENASKGSSHEGELDGLYHAATTALGHVADAL
jgi:hypothetical protein